MKFLKIAYVSIVMSVSVFSFAGDGASNSTIITTLTNDGANVAIEGNTKVAVVKVNGDGEANSGTVKIKGSVKDSTIYTDVNNKSTNVAIGNANAGSVIYDFTN